MKNQKFYDSYWNITFAYTNYNGDRFIAAVREIILFIDRNKNSINPQKQYLELQTELNSILGINLVSVRKIINQLIKLGFINTGLNSYSPDAKSFIHARTDTQRKTILSRIVYSNSSLSRTVTSDSDKKEINFIIKTLETIKSLDKNDLAALMLMDISKEFADKNDIDQIIKTPLFSSFKSRKYNQISHLWNLLKKLDGIRLVNNKLFLEKEDDQISERSPTEKGRDKYLHLIYKNQLKDEVRSLANSTVCMVENIDYPILIASHIKPFHKSNTQEAYDSNNGLLLNMNVDYFFDKGLLSFNSLGEPIISKKLNTYSKNLHDYLSGKHLPSKFLNEKRLKYLDYHRKNVFN